MITIKNKLALQKMESVGKSLSEVFDEIPSLLKMGLTTQELDYLIESKLKLKNLVPQTKGYKGYKHSSCISVNEEVVHGVPGSRILKDGDLVKIDICVARNGYCADMARCFFVGEGSPEAKKLVAAAYDALDAGIKAAVTGNRLSDISYAIQTEIQNHGYGIVRDFAGHGIGKSMHEEPEILNFGTPGQGPKLLPGMTFAIEPMLTMGKHMLYVATDGWTAITKDGSLSAHVEDTIAITESGPRILTRPFKG